MPMIIGEITVVSIWMTLQQKNCFYRVIKKSLCNWWCTVIVRCTETFWSHRIINIFSQQMHYICIC